MPDANPQPEEDNGFNAAFEKAADLRPSIELIIEKLNVLSSEIEERHFFITSPQKWALEQHIKVATAFGLIHPVGLHSGGGHWDGSNQFASVGRRHALRTITHISKEARRALSILDNPKGYHPRARALYGGEIAGFEPLFR